MTAKEYLMRAYRCNELIRSNTEEIDRLRELAISVRGQNFESEFVAHSSSGDAGFTKIVDKITELENEILAENECYLTILRETRSAINILEDSDEKLCLRLRYLNFLSWEEIAERMNYSTAQIYRIHGRALKNVKI